MVENIITSSWVFTQFILPFLLIWVIVFAILQKTKLLGENKQVDSIVAIVIAFIFVAALQPKEIVSNLILFLTVALVVVFVGLLLWGFVSGKEMKENILGPTWAKWVFGIVVVVAVIIALLWASGIQNNVVDFFFRQSWSQTFWVNAIFVIVIAAALALVLRNQK